MLHQQLQQQGNWHFDLISAIIGAAIALVVVRIIYVRREAIKQFALKLWQPVAKLRNRLQASQEEKYLADLQETLKGLLFFMPDDPQRVFQPPTFAAPAPLPTALPEENAVFPTPLDIAFANLQDGHPRIIITGQQGTGRTCTLAMTVWQTATRAPQKQAYARLPIWIDLTHFKDIPDTEDLEPLERLARLATIFLPSVTAKWTLDHLQTEPSLILIDNWEQLPASDRADAARWVSDAAQHLPDSYWLIAANQTGYGPLIEANFVPLELIPASGTATVTALYHGWQHLLETGPETPPEDDFASLLWADQAGGTLLELTIRTILYLQTGQLPARPVDVLDRFLDNAISHPNLGEDQAEVAEQARMFALNALSQVAKVQRLENRGFSQEDIDDLIDQLLPPEENRPPRLENTVRKLLTESKMLRRYGRMWTLAHPIWADFLTAWALTEDENGRELAKQHLIDPTWWRLLECYAGLADVTPMIRDMINDAITYGDYANLLRATRWSLAAPGNVAWRKGLLKVLAQTFTASDVDPTMRLKIGRALVLAAGEGARAFFLQTMRHPSTDIRAAGLRGLGWAGSPQEMPLLSTALNDENAQLATSAVQALTDIGTPGAIRVLGDALHLLDETLLPSVAEALAKSAEGQAALREAADDESLMIRKTAAFGLGEIDAPWAHEILQRLAREDSEWLVRSAAEIGLNAREERATNKVVALAPPPIDQTEWLITWAAQRGEGLGVGEAALEMLEQVTTSGDSESKMLAAMTLAYIGRESHRDILEPLLADENLTVRQVVEQAIRRIDLRYYVY